MGGDEDWYPCFAVPPRDHPAHREVAAFFEKLRWTPHSHEHRSHVVEQISRRVRKRLPGVKTELFGSTRLKTYLPDGDVDITLCQTHALTDADCKANEADILRTLVGEILPPMVSQQPEQINAEVKLVKCVIDGLQVDITIDQYGGLTTVRFLEQVNQEIGHDGLFKKSLILIKAWACYEARILGANGGLLGSYALTVMLIAVFQQIDPALLPTLTPLDILQRFVEYYAAFDFTHLALSVLGPVPLVTSPLPTAAQAAVAAVAALACVATPFTHPPSVLSVKFFMECRGTLNVGAMRKSLQQKGRSAPQTPGAAGVPSPPPARAAAPEGTRNAASAPPTPLSTQAKRCVVEPPATPPPPPIGPPPTPPPPEEDAVPQPPDDAPPPQSPVSSPSDTTPSPVGTPTKQRCSPPLVEAPTPPPQPSEASEPPSPPPEDRTTPEEPLTPTAVGTPERQGTALVLEERTLSQVSQGSQTAWREGHDDVLDAGIQCDSLPGQGGTASTPHSSGSVSALVTPSMSPSGQPRSPPVSPVVRAGTPPKAEPADEVSALTTLEVPFFPIRSYNILDPLRQHNNLGRSIGRGNGARVQASFRQAAVELQYLCHKLAKSKRRHASHAEHAWLKAWLSQRRGESWAKIIYGPHVPEGLDEPALVRHFFRHSLIAVERRRVRETSGTNGTADAGGVDKSKTRSTQTAGAQAVGVQTGGGNTNKIWTNFNVYPGGSPAAGMLLNNVSLDMMVHHQDPNLLGQYATWWQQQQKAGALAGGYDGTAFDPMMSQEFNGDGDVANSVNGLAQTHTHHKAHGHHPHHQHAMMHQGQPLHPHHTHHQHVPTHPVGLQLPYHNPAAHHGARHNAPPHMRHHLPHQLYRPGHGNPSHPTHSPEYPWMGLPTVPPVTPLAAVPSSAPVTSKRK